jgi:hypothetical protein
MRKMLNSCMCITIRYWGSQPNVPKFEVSVTHHIMYPIQIAIWLYHMVYQAHRIAAHSSAAGGTCHSHECTELARTYHLQADRGERGATQERLGRNGVAMRTYNGSMGSILTCYTVVLIIKTLKPKNRQNQLGNAAF